MKKDRTLIGILLLLAVIWWLWPPAKTIWHYRMTVTVETPEGLKSGSAVREVIYGGETHGGGGPGLDLKVKGEAVAVDLGQRGVLFGLLKGGIQGYDYATDILLTAFNDGRLDPTSVPKQGKVTLKPEQYPVFVRFRDPKDPRTVENVLETEFYDDTRDGAYHGRKFRINADHFEEMFGEGVHLKEVTLEITNEPVTNVVMKFIPSFGPETGYPEWFKKLRYGDPHNIGPYDFKIGT